MLHHLGVRSANAERRESCIRYAYVRTVTGSRHARRQLRLTGCARLALSITVILCFISDPYFITVIPALSRIILSFFADVGSNSEGECIQWTPQNLIVTKPRPFLINI